MGRRGQRLPRAGRPGCGLGCRGASGGSTHWCAIGTEQGASPAWLLCPSPMPGALPPPGLAGPRLLRQPPSSRPPCLRGPAASAAERCCAPRLLPLLQWRSSTMDGCGVKITKQSGSTTYLAEEGEFVNDEWVSRCSCSLCCAVAACRHSAAAGPARTRRARDGLRASLGLLGRRKGLHWVAAPAAAAQHVGCSPGRSAPSATLWLLPA